jgi:hypothetical protein
MRGEKKMSLRKTLKKYNKNYMVLDADWNGHIYRVWEITTA